MKSKAKLSLLASLLALAFLFSLSSISATDISTCSNLSSPDTYYLTANIVNSVIPSCIKINSSNVTLDCQGYMIDGTGSISTGLQLAGGWSNITIKNCIIKEWNSWCVYAPSIQKSRFENVNISSCPTGLYIDNSPHNYFLNVNSSYCSSNGLYMTQSTNITIENSSFQNNVYNVNYMADPPNFAINFINVIGTGNKPILFYNTSQNIQNWNNNFSGIILANSNGNNLSNINLSGAGNAIILNRANFGNLSNINISNAYGLMMASASAHNTLSNLFVKDSYVGISLGAYTYNNTITNSIFKNNTYGTYLSNSGSIPNKFYNNLFNQTTNFFQAGTNYRNNWNTTRQTGTRVDAIPGVEIGGNFWTNSVGTGFSNTCTDADYDGFCDSSYALNANNTDYLVMSDEYVSNNITNCTNLLAPNKVYTLQNDIINATTTCLNITASNVIIDGNGYTLDGVGGGSGSGYGIYALGYNNITIKNFKNITDFAQGIRFYSVSNSKIQNITFFDNYFSGIYFIFVSNTNISDINSSYDTYSGIYLFGGSNNRLLNTITSNTDDYGLWLQGESGTIMTNVISHSNAYNGLLMESSTSGVSLFNPSFYNNVYEEIKGSNYYPVTIEYNNSYGRIKFLNAISQNVDGDMIFGNSKTTLNGYCSDNLINAGEICDDGNVIADDGCSPRCQMSEPPPEPADYCGDGIINSSVEECDDGNMIYGDGCSGRCQLESTIIIGNNSAFLNSSAIPALNVSANITLDLTGWNFSNPRIFKDGAICPANECYNYTPLTDSIVTFNITSWSDYVVVGETTLVTNCTNLSYENTYYVLQNNITTIGTCFNITANNVTLDGNGYYIDGDDSGTDFGIVISANNGITIRNFGGISDFYDGINGAVSLNNSLIENVIITSNINDGIVLEIKNSILENIILNSNSYGIWASGSTNNVFKNINASSNTNEGIAIPAGSNNNLLMNIKTNSNGGAGIGLTFSVNNTIYNLNSYSNTGYEVYAFDWTSASGNVLVYNNSYGEIKLKALNESIEGVLRYGTGQNIILGNNSAYVNSTALPSLNKSANITLNLLGHGMLNPRILKDGSVCSAPNCNVLSYNATTGIILFNVTGWSEYTIEDVPVPTDKETFRDEIINGFVTASILIGILVIVALIFFALAYFRKDGEWGVGGFEMDGDKLVNIITIIAGALLVLGVAIFIIAKLMA